MGLFSSMMGPQGLVGYYGLSEWWMGLFTPEETNALEAAYARSPALSRIGQGQLSLTRGMTQGFQATQSPARFLTALAPIVGDVAHDKEPVVWAKAEELGLKSDDVLDLHVVYSGSIKAFYARRDESEDYLDAAMSAAEELVNMAPDAASALLKKRPGRDLPPHRGFKLLAVAAERDGDYEEALALCREAEEQGWTGDWDVRIERLLGKAAQAGVETETRDAGGGEEVTAGGEEAGEQADDA